MAASDENTSTEAEWEIPKEEYHAHFDCFSGAAGDMMFASCLDLAGLEQKDLLLNHVSNCLKLGMPEIADEFEISVQRVWRGGMGSIAGLHVDVKSKFNHSPAPVPTNKKPEEEIQQPSSTDHDHSHTHGHNHGHSDNHSHTDSNVKEAKHQHHDHSHSHHSLNDQEDLSRSNVDQNDNDPASSSHEHSHSHGHSHSHNHTNDGNGNSKGPLRNLPQIVKLLNDASDQYIAPWAREMAIAAFTELAYAEAQTHGADSIDSVHFHEVGAVDSIVDTVGTCIALHCLGVASVSCSRLPIGEGTVWTDHGLLPVPAPATLRLLVDMPVCQVSILFVAEFKVAAIRVTYEFLTLLLVYVWYK